MKVKLLIIGILTFFLPYYQAAECGAKIREMTGEAAISVGYILLDDELGSNDRFFTRIDLGANLTHKWGFEVSLLNSVHSLARVPDLTFYNVSAVYHIMEKANRSPYVVMGLGAGNFNTDKLNNESKFNVSVGGGVKWFLERDLAYKIDLRDQIIADDLSHNITVSFGIMYLFDLFETESPSVIEEEPEPEEMPEPIEEVPAAPVEEEKEPEVVIDMPEEEVVFEEVQDAAEDEIVMPEPEEEPEEDEEEPEEVPPPPPPVKKRVPVEEENKWLR
ncbi:MAG: outer membrane beta-barrel protein [Nitrospirota bacterium]|nr:MAG: outer membrane beta-barrel protein [Nitrospirota bacterium]